MRLNWLSCGVAALSLTATMAVAQPPGDGERPRGGFGDRRGGDRPEGEREAPPMVKALDTNADGKITAEELKNATKALMALDGNGDGVLTEEEYGRPRGPRGGFGGGPGGGMGDFMGQFDKDGDGKISKEEAPERMRENFDRMDVNGDGVLDQSDFEAMRDRFRQGGGPGGPGGDMASRMKEMDKNGDGKISKEEAPDRMKENFDQIDTNKDGQVDEAEIRQMFERFRGQGGRPGGDRPGGGRPEGDRPERPKAEFE